MNDRQLECFFLTAETGNLVKVAERLFLSVSTVSYQLKNLEEELGIVLFERTGKSMSLTPSGNYYLEQMKKIAATHSEILQRAKKIQQKDTELIIGFINEIALEIYAPLAARLKKQYPNILIKAVPVSYGDSAKPLLYKTVDMMFTYECRVIKEKDIDFITLKEEDFYCAISTTNPLSSKQRLQLSDLNGYTVFFAQEDERWVLDLINRLEADPGIYGQRVEYPMFIPMMIKECQGVGIFPYHKDLMADSGIVYIPIDCGRKVARVLAWRKDCISSEIEQFKEITHSFLGK